MATNLVMMAFMQYHAELMEILNTNKEMKKTAKSIFKQAAWGAAGVVAGGVVAGPVGAVVGGVAASVVGFKLSNKYKSFIKILQELTDDEKAELVKKVQEMVGSARKDALTKFISSPDHRTALVKLLRSSASKMDKGI